MKVLTLLDGTMKKLLAHSLLSTVLLTGALLSPARADSAAGELTTVAALDVPRYMGKWQELARFPTWFQEKCIAESSAEYSLNQDGTVRVINRCRLANGSINEAEGLARQIGGATSPKLKVRFAPAWLSFIPGVWGDYWVIDIDPDYQWVAVGEPKREYLWILTRNQPFSQSTYAALVSRLAEKGFDTKKLVLSGKLEP